MLRAQLIASAITANCEQYHARKIDYAQWSDEQYRLWDLAAKRRGVDLAVRRILAPSQAVAR